MNYKKYIIVSFSIIISSYLCVKFLSPNFVLFAKKPNLIKGLPSEISVAERKFKIRVQNLFPPSTLNAEIKRELSNQGFSLKSYQSKKIASYKTYHFFCDSIWIISWKVNERNEIYNLMAKYNVTCL